MKLLSVKSIRPSKIYNILEPLSFEDTLFIRAGTKNKLVLSRIKEFFAGYNRVRIKIGGEDLKKLKIKPGPLYTKLLVKVLHKKIDGEVKTKHEELEFVKRLLG